MNLDQVFEVFEQARQACGHKEYVVIGSLSILGFEEAGTPPADMTMSNDIDSYTRLDPGRILDLKPLLGEDSPFHVAHGFWTRCRPACPLYLMVGNSGCTLWHAMA